MKILFTTLHAKYVHASLALPYLAVSAPQVAGVDYRILELTINELPDVLLAKLHAEQADAVLFSCYIWNTELTLKLASDLKQLQPDTFIALGGPEVSFGAFDLMVRNPAINCIIRGEGEATCRELIDALHRGTPLDEIAGLTYREGDEVIANPERGAIAHLDDIPSPFAAALVDLKKPLVYYETSRGCPFSCAFCMSSIEQGVRSFSTERIKRDLLVLIEAGAQTVKLADRTFNYDAGRANEIWRFILEHNRDSKFHFEIAAELLTEENLALLGKVPPGVFRFEIGVQSGGEETLAKVERKSSLEKLYANVERLKATSGVTVHLDLVAGLPGESLEGFLASVQGLFALGADHIQVEPLKVLKGTAMRGIARKERYAYSEAAPYKILSTPWLSFDDIRRIEGISRLLDQLHNSGRFNATLREFEANCELSRFFNMAAEFFDREGVSGNLSLAALFEALWRFATASLKDEKLERLCEALCYDFCLTGYPGGNTPSFFEKERHTRESLPVRTASVPGERVRRYRRSFARDYRTFPWREERTEMTFVYRSAPGEGLRVQVL